MSTAPAVNQFNASYLQSIGRDGQYNRDRLFQQIGVRPGPDGSYATVSLTDSQRQQMKALLEQETGQSFKGLDIDTAGNLNEPEGFGHYAKKYGPLAGGIALSVFGIPGVIPGLLGGGGGAAAGASGAAFDAAPSISSLTGAANAASVGTAAAGAPSMGLWGSIGKFLGSSVGQQAIQSGTGLVGNLLQSNSAQHASDTQAQAAKDALDFEKGVYSKDVQDFAPYQTAGAQSIGRLSSMLGQPRQPMNAQSLYNSGQVQRGPGLSSMLGGGGQMVTLQAPDGTTRQFAPNDPKVALALGKGAVRV